MSGLNGGRWAEGLASLRRYRDISSQLRKTDPGLVPIVIICRDRVSGLRELVAWLENAGHRRILLLDNDSSYPALVDYYADSPHEVIRLGDNSGHFAPWASGLAQELANDGPYVITDSDVVPAASCPMELVGHLLQILARYPTHIKVGPGLRLDDIPAEYARYEEVIGHEMNFWRYPVGRNVYHAPIDTTFALYPPGDAEFYIGPALRTGSPYLLRHLPWYEVGPPSDEAAYYLARKDPAVGLWGAQGGSRPTKYHRPSRRRRYQLPLYSIASRIGVPLRSTLSGRLQRGAEWSARR